MRKRLVVALIAALMAMGTVTAVAASTTTEVACTITDNTLSCPLPAPVTVTSTETATVTETPATVTTTQTVTQQPTTDSSPVSPSPTTSAQPSTTPTGPPSAWPDASNTGVPAGVTLTPYPSGSTCLINQPTVIDGKILNCTVLAYSPGVVIRNSRVNGAVYLDSDRGATAKTWSVTIENSVVDAGTQNGAAVSNGNITIRRSEIKGGQTIVQCMENSTGCTIEDSWLHGQSIPPMQAEPHLGGFLNSGGPNVTLRHNRIACDNPNGCTGDVVQLPDFGPITNALIENNLLAASDKLAYCTYAGWRPNDFATKNHDIVYRGNVFVRGSNSKCGAYGPVTGWRDNPGNVWANNTWDDGTPVAPAS